MQVVKTLKQTNSTTTNVGISNCRTPIEGIFLYVQGSNQRSLVKSNYESNQNSDYKLSPKIKPKNLNFKLPLEFKQVPVLQDITTGKHSTIVQTTNENINASFRIPAASDRKPNDIIQVLVGENCVSTEPAASQKRDMDNQTQIRSQEQEIQKVMININKQSKALKRYQEKQTKWFGLEVKSPLVAKRIDLTQRKSAKSNKRNDSRSKQVRKNLQFGRANQGLGTQLNSKSMAGDSNHINMDLREVNYKGSNMRESRASLKSES